MRPSTDSNNDGRVNANRVTQAKGLSAGFDYGDQEEVTPVGAAYQFKREENTSKPIQKKSAALAAPTYGPSLASPNSLDKEQETTQLKEVGQSLTASASAPEDSGIGNNPTDSSSPNNTGLPDNLKSGIESMSGLSMDDVKVHRNSAKPAQLQAHAYAQGSDIHLGAGQEKHLPHEAWHVVQQKQGRVQPTTQLKGKVPVNDDAGLEKEADVMGAKAIQMKTQNSSALETTDKPTSDGVQQLKGVVQLGRIFGNKKKDKGEDEKKGKKSKAPKAKAKAKAPKAKRDRRRKKGIKRYMEEGEEPSYPGKDYESSEHLREVPIAQLDLSEGGDKSDDELRKNLLKKGYNLFYAILVTEDEEGVLKVIDGHHRITEMIRQGEETIPAYVVPKASFDEQEVDDAWYATGW